MQTIGTILGSEIRRDYRPVTELPDTGSIGIELELEGGSFKNVVGWDVHNDGSLRDGVEYVFQGAQGGSKALDSIMAMGDAFKGMNPKPTFRCSTHCHLDVRDLTIPQVHKLVAAYSILEDVMFDHCQEYRRWSNFCTPYFVSDRLIENYTGLNYAGNDNQRIHNLGQFPKYSSLNIQPIGRFGSVEFRGSHALTSGEELLGLAQRMLHLKRLVLESPTEQTLSDFVGLVNKMNPLQAFPQGLVGNYTRDQELADICYGNALKLQKGIEGLGQEKAPNGDYNPFGAAALAEAMEARAQVLRTGFGRGNGRPVPNEANQRVVQVRTEGFERYGIIIPQEPVSEDQAIRILRGMSRIIGIVPPTARTLFHIARMQPDRLEAFRQACVAHNIRI